MIIAQVVAMDILPVLFLFWFTDVNPKVLLQLTQYASSCGGMQTIMADLHKATGQNMQAEPAQELDCIECHQFQTVIVMVIISDKQGHLFRSKVTWSPVRLTSLWLLMATRWV